MYRKKSIIGTPLDDHITFKRVYYTIIDDLQINFPELFENNELLKMMDTHYYVLNYELLFDYHLQYLKKLTKSEQKEFIHSGTLFSGLMDSDETLFFITQDTYMESQNKFKNSRAMIARYFKHIFSSFDSGVKEHLLILCLEFFSLCFYLIYDFKNYYSVVDFTGLSFYFALLPYNHLIFPYITYEGIKPELLSRIFKVCDGEKFIYKSGNKELYCYNSLFITGKKSDKPRMIKDMFKSVSRISLNKRGSGSYSNVSEQFKNISSSLNKDYGITEFRSLDETFEKILKAFLFENQTYILNKK